MTNSGPLVSVIVPVYNREKYLGAALESIFRQAYRPLEVIVVDDGSTDGSAAVAQSFPEVKYLYQSNQGVAAARNAGVTFSRGEFLAFQDSDDLWTPDKLAVQMTFHLRNHQVGCSAAHMKNFVEPGLAAVDWVPPDWLTRDVIAGLPTLVVRRTTFDRVGAFDAAYRVAEDIDWLTRARDAGVQVEILPEVLGYRRVHDTNLTAQTKLGAENRAKIMKASIDRKRRGASAPPNREDRR